MKIKPAELTGQGYILLDKLEHDALAPFLKKYLNKRTRTSILYYAITIFIILSAVVLFVFNDHSGKKEFGNWCFHFFSGFLLSFLLIPLHEYIHVLAYRFLGADKTSFSANMKKFHFLALADQFVADRKEFRIIALSPFISLSLLMMIIIPWVPYHTIITILGILFMHTAMCSGDFALISYLEYYHSRQIVTYDDVEMKTSFFYGKEA